MLCVHDFKPRPDFGEDEESVLRRLAAIAMDEIDFHRIETERELLLRELSHRVKNVYSTIASVANMSGRGDPSAAPYLESFNGRLAAMGAAHDQLLTSSWKSARLIEIVQSVVATLPEFDSRGDDAQTAPEGRYRNICVYFLILDAKPISDIGQRLL